LEKIVLEKIIPEKIGSGVSCLVYCSGNKCNIEIRDAAEKVVEKAGPSTSLRFAPVGMTVLVR